MIIRKNSKSEILPFSDQASNKDRTEWSESPSKALDSESAKESAALPAAIAKKIILPKQAFTKRFDESDYSDCSP